MHLLTLPPQKKNVPKTRADPESPVGPFLHLGDALDDLAERLRSNRERRALEELKRRGEET